jgi:hypothetical protein
MSYSEWRQYLVICRQQCIKYSVNIHFGSIPVRYTLFRLMVIYYSRMCKNNNNEQCVIKLLRYTDIKNMFIYATINTDTKFKKVASIGLSAHFLTYEGISKSFRTGRLERELQMVNFSATRCSCIAILWVSVVSFAVVILSVVSQRVFIFVRV